MTPDRLQAAADLLARHLPGVAAVYLYGSQARGDARPDSDVDLGVLAAGPLDRQALIGAYLKLASALGPVDLVDLSAASTVLGREVLIDGVRLLAPDRVAADLWEIRVLRDYEDLKRRRSGIDADIIARGRVLA